MTSLEPRPPLKRKAHEKKHPGDPALLPAFEAVRQTTDLWRLAFDASPDLISIHDTEYRIVAVNKAMADTLDSTPEALQGCHCHDVVHQTDCPPIVCPLQLLYADGHGHQAEVYEKHLDLWLLVTVNPLYDQDRRLIGSIHIARDISSQKKDQQALQESRQRFHHLSEATMEGVLLSANRKIILANQVLADMFGYTMEELEGMNIIKLVIPEQRELLIQSMRSRHVGIHEFECTRKDGTRFPIQTHVREVSYRNRPVYQAAIRDLTEQKKIELERASRERLQGVLQTAGAVCHEINQPMMALFGYLDLLGSQLPSHHPAFSKLSHIKAQARRIENITRQLMNITQYRTKPYAGGDTIIDIDQSAGNRTNDTPPSETD